jgi:hypothetical protein
MADGPALGRWGLQEDAQRRNGHVHHDDVVLNGRLPTAYDIARESADVLQFVALYTTSARTDYSEISDCSMTRSKISQNPSTSRAPSSSSVCTGDPDAAAHREEPVVRVGGNKEERAKKLSIQLARPEWA